MWRGFLHIIWRKAFLSRAHFFNALFSGQEQQMRVIFHIEIRPAAVVAPQ
jgi:hypothetical protein